MGGEEGGVRAWREEATVGSEIVVIAKGEYGIGELEIVPIAKGEYGIGELEIVPIAKGEYGIGELEIVPIAKREQRKRRGGQRRVLLIVHT